jgi:hypothetical protein
MPGILPALRMALPREALPVVRLVASSLPVASVLLEKAALVPLLAVRVLSHSLAVPVCSPQRGQEYPALPEAARQSYPLRARLLEQLVCLELGWCCLRREPVTCQVASPERAVVPGPEAAPELVAAVVAAPVVAVSFSGVPHRRPGT